MANNHEVESSNILRWGLIGYGDLAGKRVAAALQDAQGSALNGIWGRDYAKAQSFAENHHIPQAHETLESLLNSEIDAVYVCTPPDSHAEYALAAIAAGKHVLGRNRWLRMLPSARAWCRRHVSRA